MRNPKTINGILLVALLLLAALVLSYQGRTTTAAQEQPARLFEIVGMSVPFEQRVGVDDGAAFVVHFSGDTRGTLDTCG
jgi:hypothetical protein